jgi:hypothetical protein
VLDGQTVKVTTIEKSRKNESASSIMTPKPLKKPNYSGQTSTGFAENCSLSSSG